MAGFIKIYRQLEKWEWYTDSNTKSLFLHCLIRANHSDNKWRGIEIKKGSFVTSYGKLAKETGLSVREVRTSINRLKSTNEITHKTTSQYSVINVVKWANYQGYDKQSDIDNDTLNDKQATNERQASDKPSTTNKNEKNYKNKELPISTYSDSQKICEQYGASSLLELFEKEFKRPLSNIDIQKVIDWEEKVGTENVIDGLRECVIYQKTNINYLDKVLVSWLDSNKISKPKEEVDWNDYNVE